MFLAQKLKLTNNVRHRLGLTWGPFLVRKFGTKYKQQHFKHFVDLKLPAYFLKGFFINKFNKKVYSIISDSTNNNVITPCQYGSIIGYCATTHHYISIFYKEFMDWDDVAISKTFIKYCIDGDMVYYIRNPFNGVQLASSAGVFAVICRQEGEVDLTTIRLPSGQFKLIPSISELYRGRNGNIYSKYVVWGSWGYKFKNKHHRPVVRGVAMNPVDHPNGGRCKVKKPFRNKYNKIAKKGK